MKTILSETVGEQFYLYLRADAFVEYVINGIEYGHIDMQMAVFLLHAFCSEESFRNHFHLYLRALHTVSLANHCSEGAVAREFGVACHKQVAQINGVIDAAFNRIDGCKEARHLLHGVSTAWKLSPYFNPLQMPEAMA